MQKHAWGAAIILSSAGGVGTNEIMRRTQPGLPLKKGRLGTMTHDYKRHGTTTLFAELNVLDGPSSAATCSATAIRSSCAS